MRRHSLRESCGLAPKASPRTVIARPPHGKSGQRYLSLGRPARVLADSQLLRQKGVRILSAVDAVLAPSFSPGAHGAVAAILTAVPECCVELWNAVQEEDHQRAKRLHDNLLGFWNAIDHPNLPANVKPMPRRIDGFLSVDSVGWDAYHVSLLDADRCNAYPLRAISKMKVARPRWQDRAARIGREGQQGVLAIPWSLGARGIVSGICSVAKRA